MKKISYFVVLLSLLSGSSAFAISKGIEVSFYSIGSGTDQDGEKIVQALVAAEVGAEKVSKYTVEHWGREGETNYCIQFSTEDNFKKFEKRVTKATKASEHVRVDVKESC